MVFFLLIMAVKRKILCQFLKWAITILSTLSLGYLCFKSMNIFQKRFYRRSRRMVWVAVFVSFCLSAIYLCATEKRLDINNVKMQIELSLRESVSREKGSGCDVLHIDQLSGEISKYLPDLPKVTCHGIDWVECYMSECYITEELKSRVKNIDCAFRDIIYVTDLDYSLAPQRTIRSNERYKLKYSDYVKISCSGNIPGAIRSTVWEGYKAGFRHIKKKLTPAGLFNVLILGFDSTSHSGFQRHMPNVYQFLTEELQATILNRYNVLGDGTPAALFPLLAGKTEWELPDARKFTNNTIDVKYFIFDALDKAGYRTALFEDRPEIGTFQYRFNGFRKQPADHYIRHLLQASNFPRQNWWGKKGVKSKGCAGAVPEYLMLLNLTAQLFELAGNQFCFTFIVQLTHDEFNLKTAEDDTLNFLGNLLASGKLENTMLVMMSDHGIRFSSEFRSTYLGKLEERLPFMAIVLPQRLKRENPDAESNLKRNTDVLTTAFDVYETIVEVLRLKGRSNPYKVPGSDLPRGMSLLKPISSSRSCGEAGVETHWCACVQWFNVSRTDPMFERAGIELADRINSITAPKRSLCAERQIVSIEWVMKQNVNDKLLRFDGNKDQDGFFSKFATKSTARASVENYQVKIVMSPGKAVYEGSLKYYVKTGHFLSTDRAISRINAYGEDPHCVSVMHPHLNKYCYCKRHG